MAEWDAASDSSWRRGGERKAEQRCCSNTLRTGFKLKLSELHITKCVDSKAKCPVNERTHQFLITLIVSLSLHIVHIVQIRKKQPPQKKKSFTVSLSQNIHRAEHCLFAAALRQMKSLSAASPYSRPSPKSPWIVRTQSRYEFVTCRHFILSCRQLFSQEAAPWLQAALGQVFLSAAFLCGKKNPKRVVSMLSGNYTAQDISPSYLALKDTSVVVTIWVSPLAQLAILKPGNKLDKRQDQCFMGWLLHGNYDFEKLGPSPSSRPKQQRKTGESWRAVINTECMAGLSLTVAG